MADNRNTVHQEWSFEWTWTSGCDEDPSSTSSPRGIFHDGSSEIQMEYSFQPPGTVTSISGGQQQQQQQRRPKSYHMGESQGVREEDIVTTRRPTTLVKTAAAAETRPKGTNGKWRAAHPPQDSGYGSSDLSPQSRTLKTPTTSDSVKRDGGTNGRSRNTCNITLESNAGDDPVTTGWTTTRQQPVFHGPNCECIVCHDMQVRFESTPPPHVRSRLRSKPASSEEPVKRVQRPYSMSAVSPSRSGDRGGPIDPGTLTSTSSVQRMRQTFDDAGSRRRRTDETSWMSRKDRSEEVCDTEPPTTAEPGPPMYRSHFCTHVPNRRTASSSLSAGDVLPSQVSRQWTDPGFLRKTGSANPTGDDSYRYSYPSSSSSTPKPRIIHIDVYCTEDDDDDDGSTGTSNQPEVAAAAAVRSSPFVQRTVVEDVHRKSFVGPSTKRPGRHVGPARNRNCDCVTCVGYYSDLKEAADGGPADKRYPWVVPVSQQPRRTSSESRGHHVV